jgi:hypothetical protein
MSQTTQPPGQVEEFFEALEAATGCEEEIFWPNLQ